MLMRTDPSELDRGARQPLRAARPLAMPLDTFRTHGAELTAAGRLRLSSPAGRLAATAATLRTLQADYQLVLSSS
jgi:hypothetical protein